MKILASPGSARLFLLALLTLLVFGNCGGGVQGFISGLGAQRRARLQSIILHERAQRAAARQQLRGRARRAEYKRITTATQARLDSLMKENYYNAERTKLAHRRSKIERQLFQSPAKRPLVQPIRWPMPDMH
jgi:hypothetical protein